MPQNSLYSQHFVLDYKKLQKVLKQLRIQKSLRIPYSDSYP